MTVQFQPPPTFAEVVVFDQNARTEEERLRSAKFNPVWLKWFVDIAQLLTGAGGGTGAVVHNSLSGLQGGSAGEEYHLSAADYSGTGTGVVVRTTSPSLVTPTLGVAAATSLNITGGRLRLIQGAQVTAANNLVLGTDGNYFQVAGATQINLIDNSTWSSGPVMLKFNAAPTVKHNQAASGNNKPVMLSGAVDFVASANDTLTLVYDSTDSKWYEVARTVI